MKVKILGSGTSQGIPVIACSCHVCHSSQAKDKRLRASIHIQINDKSIVVDAGPDFRQQMLRAHILTLDAIVFTHEHKDHIAGLDDVRAYNYKEDKPMKVYARNQVIKALQREFHYVFENASYPGVPKLEVIEIENKPFEIEGITLEPIEVMHYKMPVFGYRIGDFTYITDAKTIAESEIEKVKGTKVLIVNALHQSEHISHFNLKEALAFIALIKPEKAYLTHISHLFGTHEEIEKLLPPNVFATYDGMEIEI